MLIGAFLWGDALANFCSVIANADPEWTEQQQTLRSLNSFMEHQDLSKDLRRRLRTFFFQSHHLQVADKHRELLTLMSPALQCEVSIFIHEDWLLKVWFFQKVEPEFLVQIALNLTAAVFSPQECIQSGHGFLYILHRGEATCRGKVLKAGDIWGTDVLLESQDQPQILMARSFMEVPPPTHRITRAALPPLPLTPTTQPCVSPGVRHTAI